MTKKIPVVKPLKVPEPCVIDELPEVVTVVDRWGMVWCHPDVMLNDDGSIRMPPYACGRWSPSSYGYDIRYVAGVE